MKGLCTVGKTLKVTCDLGMTLTFDLHDIQLQVMNAQKLQHVHTKFGQVAMDSLIFFLPKKRHIQKSLLANRLKNTQKRNKRIERQ